MTLYQVLQLLARPTLRLLTGFSVQDADHVPRSGPFLLISNHQSILDPVFIQVACPRTLHTMAKSTQFAAPVVGRVMTRFHAFPVRRYQIDPFAVRTVLRRLDDGQGVGIYIEGERAWDGRLQEPRLGTVRLILKAGVPVIPCVVDGSYDVVPRWDSRPRRAPVRVAFGPALRFRRMDDRAEREAAIGPAAETVMATLRRMLRERESVEPDREGT